MWLLEGRGKDKEIVYWCFRYIRKNCRYNIYFLIRYYRVGAKELKEFQSNAGNKLVHEMQEKLAGKFASPDHADSKDIADFLGLMNENEIEITKRDAYEQMQALIDLI